MPIYCIPHASNKQSETKIFIIFLGTYEVINRENNYIFIISLCKSKLGKRNLFNNFGINNSEAIQN